MNRTNDTPDLDRRFPTLTEILGPKEVQKVFRQLTCVGKDADALFHQAEIDLGYLKRRLNVQSLRRAYRKQLEDSKETIQAMYEIYTAALLASITDDIDLHVPGQGAHKPDFRVKIRGCEIYGEVKTRDDRDPFKAPPVKDESGVELYSSVRATVDYRMADIAAPPGVATSESTSLRNRIEDALDQLPSTHPNLIVLGLVDKFAAFETTRQNLEAVILGDSRDRFFRDRSGRVQHVAERLGNSVFDNPVYGEQITSIAWLCLKRTPRGMIRRSGIFFNDNAKHRLPDEVQSVLEDLLDREKTLNRELARIVVKLKSDYQPEKIILFGSLAHGTAKEGSDIDLAIIKQTDKRPLDRSLEVARICQPSLAVNFTVYTPSEFRQKQQTGDFFVVEEILQKGRVLYER
jgi:predicted nucleotidyltransferase